MTQENSATKEPAFEDILDRLHTLVEQLEAGDLPLDKSVQMFEEGIELARQGHIRLNEAEQKIEYLLSRDDGEASPRKIKDGE